MKKLSYLAIAFILFLIIYYTYFLTSNEKRLEIRQLNDLEKEEMRERIIRFYHLLSSSEKKIYSQNKEDGIIEEIFENLDLKDSNKFYVEIGAGTSDARECNSRYLREIKDWKGIMFDGTVENSSIPLYKAYILANNVVELFDSKNVPINMDFLSEDTDYADYWIMESILNKYKPKVVCHEINQQSDDLCVTVPKENDLKVWDGTSFHGASVCAFKCLAEKFDYSLVYCETFGVNCFWIRNDLIKQNLKLDVKLLQETLTTKFLWKKPNFNYKDSNREWYEIKC